jgi:hypothetical protein
MDNFKYIWFTLLLLAYQQILPAQSTLSAGDLILVTINADGDKNSDFIPPVDISANTVIYFSFSSYGKLGKEKKFNKPVSVTLNPNSNLKRLCFLTNTDLSRIGSSGSVAVYFLHSYNFLGELFIVPSD